MAIKIIRGNLFTTKCQTIVNTVNCVGIMGAGIAFEFRLRYPEMYEQYKLHCDNKKLNIGLLWLYKSKDKWVLNFPTKKHWRYPSKKEYLNDGLRKFAESYKQKGIESIAFPLLGADRGGISQNESQQIMEQYLDLPDLDVEIYLYDPTAKDDLFEEVKKVLLDRQEEQLLRETQLNKNSLKKVIEGLQDPDIHQLNQLAKINGIGTKVMEKIFTFATSAKATPKQQNLFDLLNKDESR